MRNPSELRTVSPGCSFRSQILHLYPRLAEKLPHCAGSSSANAMDGPTVSPPTARALSSVSTRSGIHRSAAGFWLSSRRTSKSPPPFLASPSVSKSSSISWAGTASPSFCITRVLTASTGTKSSGAAAVATAPPSDLEPAAMASLESSRHASHSTRRIVADLACDLPRLPPPWGGPKKDGCDHALDMGNPALGGGACPKAPPPPPRCPRPSGGGLLQMGG